MADPAFSLVYFFRLLFYFYLGICNIFSELRATGFWDWGWGRWHFWLIRGGSASSAAAATPAQQPESGADDRQSSGRL